MKKLFLLLLIIFFIKCDDVFESNGIEYPENGRYGRNLLSEKSFTLISGEDYSLTAQLETSALLEVKIYTGNWNFYFMSTNPIFYWLIDSEIDSGGEKRIFIAEAGKKNDLAINFSGSDRVYMEIYENGEKSPSRIKILKW